MSQILVIIAIFINFTSSPALAGDRRTAEFAGQIERILPTDYSVRELCPVDQVCFTNGTLIDLAFTWPCQASLSVFNFIAEEENGQLHVYLQTEIIYAESEGSCQGIVQKTKSIRLPNQYGEVILHSDSDSPVRKRDTE